MGGRPRKPIEVKEALGTANTTRARREKEVRYTPVDASKPIPLAPPYLSVNAKELWGRAVLQLSSAGVFFPSCYEYLQGYCEAFDVMEIAREDLLQNGRYVIEGETDTKAGVKRISQDWKLYREAREMMIMYGAKLGLSPADKTKVSAIAINPTHDKNQQKKIGLT